MCLFSPILGTLRTSILDFLDPWLLSILDILESLGICCGSFQDWEVLKKILIILQHLESAGIV